MRNMLILLLGASLASPALACSPPVIPQTPEMPTALVPPPLPAETGAAKPPVWLTGKAVSGADYHRDVAAKLRQSIEELKAMIARNEAGAAEQDNLAAKADADFAAKIAHEEELWNKADTILLASMTGNVQQKPDTFAAFKPLLTLKSTRRISSFSLVNNPIYGGGGGACLPPVMHRHNAWGSPALYFFRKGALTDASLIDTLDSAALASPVIREQLRLATEKAGIWPVQAKKRGR